MEPRDRLAAALHKHMNSHGYGFHYAVVKEAERVSELLQPSAQFNLIGCEIPVEVRGKDTRIDIVLGNYDHTFLIVCECKRTDPAVRNWCFQRVPYVTHNHQERYIVDQVRGDGVDIEAQGVGIKIFKDNDPYYHHASEIRSGDVKGDGQGRGAIEDAVGQVLKGTNGLMSLIQEHADLAEVAKWRYLIPVVFTTANLFTVNKEMNADLLTGNFQEAPDLKEAPFVYLQYHVSPGLRFPAKRRKRNDLAKYVQAEYIRTVAIVSAGGIEEFILAHIPQRFDNFKI